MKIAGFSDHEEMTDTDIRGLITDLQRVHGKEFTLKYLPPVVSGQGHALEWETSSGLGTLIAWTNGCVDWHIYDLPTSGQILAGHAEVSTPDELRSTILDVLGQLSDVPKRPLDPALNSPHASQ